MLLIDVDFNKAYYRAGGNSAQQWFRFIKVETPSIFSGHCQVSAVKESERNLKLGRVAIQSILNGIMSTTLVEHYAFNDGWEAKDVYEVSERWIFLEICREKGYTQPNLSHLDHLNALKGSYR